MIRHSGHRDTHVPELTWRRDPVRLQDATLSAVQTRSFLYFTIVMSPYNTRPSNKTARPGLAALSPRGKAKIMKAQGQSSEQPKGELGPALAKVAKLQEDMLTESENTREKEQLPPPPAVDKVQRGPKGSSRKTSTFCLYFLSELNIQVVKGGTEGTEEVLELHSDVEPETADPPIAKKSRASRAVLTDEDIVLTDEDEDMNGELANANETNHVDASKSDAENVMRKKPTKSARDAIELTRATFRSDGKVAEISVGHQFSGSQLTQVRAGPRQPNSKRPNVETDGQVAVINADRQIGHSTPSQVAAYRKSKPKRLIAETDDKAAEINADRQTGGSLTQLRADSEHRQSKSKRRNAEDGDEDERPRPRCVTISLVHVPAL